MKHYVITEEELEEIANQFRITALADPHPRTPEEGYVNGGVSAISKVKKQARIFTSEDLGKFEEIIKKDY